MKNRNLIVVSILRVLIVLGDMLLWFSSIVSLVKATDRPKNEENRGEHEPLPTSSVRAISESAFAPNPTKGQQVFKTVQSRQVHRAAQL
ncbi:hypothetical protein Vi05172_g978 [Venturia inaequalis]|nr:hypothetical protein Vi05172_g978 [Venturia inaequalis]